MGEFRLGAANAGHTCTGLRGLPVPKDAKYYQCMKAGLLANMQGYPPAVSVEFARKVLLSTERPNFYEVEQAVSALPPV